MAFGSGSIIAIPSSLMLSEQGWTPPTPSPAKYESQQELIDGPPRSAPGSPGILTQPYGLDKRQASCRDGRVGARTPTTRVLREPAWKPAACLCHLDVVVPAQLSCN